MRESRSVLAIPPNEGSSHNPGITLSDAGLCSSRTSRSLKMPAVRTHKALATSRTTAGARRAVLCSPRVLQEPAKGAEQALRVARKTHGCAEFHHGLVEVARPTWVKQRGGESARSCVAGPWRPGERRRSSLRAGTQPAPRFHRSPPLARRMRCSRLRRTYIRRCRAEHEDGKRWREVARSNFRLRPARLSATSARGDSSPGRSTAPTHPAPALRPARRCSETAAMNARKRSRTTATRVCCSMISDTQIA